MIEEELAQFDDLFENIEISKNTLEDIKTLVK